MENLQYQQHHQVGKNLDREKDKSVMSTDGKLTVPTTPSGGKKPGQRKRQICNVHGWKTYSTNNTIRWEKPGQRKRQINAKTFSLSRTKKAKL
jgi:hypothetical protein